MIRLAIGGGIAAALLIGAFGYGYKFADDWWEAKYAAEVAEWHAKAEKAQAVQAMQAAADAQVQSEYESRIKELQNALKDADRICFDGPDADRVRDLWGAKATKAQR